MKLGVREICEVVLKAKATTKVGNKVFYRNEPVLYFDTLKTSSLEGAATTVYAQGGRGNARLVAWEGERTVTFTMEDALMSAESFMILSGAGLIEASADNKIKQHMVEHLGSDNFDVAADGTVSIYLSEKPYLPEDGKENFAYVMAFDKDGGCSEPFIPTHDDEIAAVTEGTHAGQYCIKVEASHADYVTGDDDDQYAADSIALFANSDNILVDYYVEKSGGLKQIEITADKFGGNFYLEASTLFRDENGVDLPAEFIIPNCKIQSNFTFSMASTGDPSTFTFTMDAFPDYTRFDKSKKVLCALQIVAPEAADVASHRQFTNAQ